MSHFAFDPVTSTLLKLVALATTSSSKWLFLASELLRFSTELVVVRRLVLELSLVLVLHHVIGRVLERTVWTLVTLCPELTWAHLLMLRI